jgi:hypothetical protein
VRGLLSAAVLSAAASAQAKTTTATTTANWNDTAWDNGAPVAGDAVVIGGRIAVWYTTLDFSGTATATKGSGMSTGTQADDGTVAWVDVPPKGSVIWVR